MSQELVKTGEVSVEDGETVAFTRVDAKGYETAFTVKVEFIKKNPDYMTMKITDLLSKADITKFLHSLKGPAIVNKSKETTESFFINGKYLNPNNPEEKETIDRIKHNNQFNTKMEEILA